MILKFDYAGVSKVISGGQTGADMAGLCVARKFKIRTGGHAPNNFRTSQGSVPWLADFGLTCTVAKDYEPRTKLNVQNSDATLRLATNFKSAGEVQTLNLIRQYKKPYRDIDLSVQLSITQINEIVNFIECAQVEILNIAGNRDQYEFFGKHFTLASGALTQIFQTLLERRLLVQTAE